MTDITPKGVIERYRRAKDKRGVWESHWQECYDYALPQRDGVIRQAHPGEKKPTSFSMAPRRTRLINSPPAFLLN